MVQHFEPVLKDGFKTVKRVATEICNLTIADNRKRVQKHARESCKVGGDSDKCRQILKIC